MRRDAQAEDAGREQPPLGPVDKEGWATWNAYAADCDLRIAVTPEAMPAPIEWIPCPDLDETRGLDCRIMAARAGTHRYNMVTATHGTSSNGPLFTVRWPSNVAPTETALFEADGPARFAIRSSTKCIDNGHDATDEHHSFSVSRRDTNPTGATARAKFGESPRISDRYDDIQVRPSATAAPSGVLITEGSFRTTWLDWTSERRELLVVPDGTEATFQAFDFVQVGTHYVMTAGTLLRVYVRELGAPPIDLLARVARPQHEMTTFATDGHHIYWDEAPARKGIANESSVEKRFVAPFSLDPETYPRTRRELPVPPYASRGERPMVACGYAAQATHSSSTAPEDAYYSGLEVFRIADGHRAWLAGSRDFSWRPIQVLAVTCNEVFVHMITGRESAGFLVNIARFRLDSLDFQPPPG